MPTNTLVYDTNNSGGSWWLTEEDWDKLAAAGWNVHWVTWDKKWGGYSRPISTYKNPLRKIVKKKSGDWLGAKACSAAKKFDNPDEGIAEWSRITGQDPNDEGCPCCGPPHSFEWYDSTGQSKYYQRYIPESGGGWS